MKKVFLFSVLLLLGLCGSQLFLWVEGEKKEVLQLIVKNISLVCLAFIMIHVGLEFSIDKTRLRSYGWDYFVAFMAATLPWIFCSLYFIYFFQHNTTTSRFDIWTDALLLGRFASPTSAGILFAMLAAANLESTWMYKKARILAIFDDLDTILLLIPIKILIVGFKWESIFLFLIIGGILYLGWKKLHAFSFPTHWYAIFFYSILLTALCESLKITSPIELEILLPAFVLGCILTHKFLPNQSEKKAKFFINALFMFFVSLSMPTIDGVLMGTIGDMSLTTILWHVLTITMLANLGKMFPLLCYRKEVCFKERLALSIGMCPRGEVGAGVIIVSLGLIQSLDKNIIFIAMLSLILNLILTGLFIFLIKKLLSNNAIVQ